jgi:hypothetical protein
LPSNKNFDSLTAIPSALSYVAIRFHVGMMILPSWVIVQFCYVSLDAIPPYLFIPNLIASVHTYIWQEKSEQTYMYKNCIITYTSSHLTGHTIHMDDTYFKHNNGSGLKMTHITLHYSLPHWWPTTYNTRKSIQLCSQAKLGEHHLLISEATILRHNNSFQPPNKAYAVHMQLTKSAKYASIARYSV